MPLNKRQIINDLFSTAPAMHSEDDLAENVVIPFLEALGYNRRDIRRKVTIKSRTSRKFRKQADIVIYVKDRPAIVIETKKVQRKLQAEDVNQVLAYAQLMEPQVPYAVLTNGSRWEIYNLQDENIGGIEDFPEPGDLEAFILTHKVVHSSPEQVDLAERILVTIENKAELEQAFRKCRQILSKEGLIAEGAFDELTKVLICKFNEERRQADGIGPNRFNSAWLAGEGPLTGLTTLFADAKRAFHVFPPHSALQLKSNSTVEDIVAQLEGYGLYGVKTPLGLSGAGGDIVGSVYEAFLSGTLRGDLGQYLTPRPLIEFIVALADLQPTDRVLDLSAGSGGFLIRSFIEIKKKIQELDVDENLKSDLLSEVKENQLWGIEINPRLATLFRINMILHGDGYNHIYNGDAIRDKIFENTDGQRVDLKTIEEGHRTKFDVILMNPPFNLPYEDQSVLNDYELGRGRAVQGSDYLMLERALRLLKDDTGRLIIIMPHGIASGVTDREIREFINREAHVLACISFPVGAFKPFGGSNSRTCALYIKKKQGNLDARFVAQAEHIGFDISSKYYQPTEANDLPTIEKNFLSFMAGLK